MPDIRGLAERIKADLANPSEDVWKQFERECEEELKAAISSGDEQTANRLWFLSTVARTRLTLVRCVQHVHAKEFYEAWCGLERIEIDSISLGRNPFYSLTDYGVPDLEDLVRNWQSLYPYKLFFSPAFLEKRKECGICRATISPWHNCGHTKWQVYGGRLCVHVITDVEMLEISVVTEPVQKYSVARLVSEGGEPPVDHHDYSLVAFVADRLASPFDGFSVRWTKARHPHTYFLDRPRDGGCPCESGRPYADCCLRESGVLRPHAEVVFEKTPPGDLPNLRFLGYGEKAATRAAPEEP